MSVYLRRVVVPYEDRIAVLNAIKATGITKLYEENVLINKKPYTIFKAISSKPIVIQVDDLVMERNGTKPTYKEIVRALRVSDLDIQAFLEISSTDYAAVTINTVGNYNVTVEVTDTDDVKGTVEALIRVVDTLIPIITLTATNEDLSVAGGDATTWDPANNIASALDNTTTDVSGDVVITFKETDADGADLADLAAARTYLGTEANVVYVMYNVSDSSGNQAVEVTSTATAIA